ncbi:MULTISPECIES: hypothetical protein [unclassified Microbacterium]|uniref:hypothetical protein n=1 Tax=unclassified Microbacterium TaxID=2609290 RepID=UPI00344A76A0
MDLWREIVGWVGSALLITSLMQPTISRLRWVNLGASSLLMAYNLLLGSAPMVALNVTLIAINCVYLFRGARAARAARDALPADADQTPTPDPAEEASDRQTSR